MSIRELWARKIVRFISVGLINTVLDFAILNTLVFAFGLKLIDANLISASICVCISYFLTNSLVFSGRHKKSLKLFLKFVLVTGCSLLLIQTGIIYSYEHIVTIHFLSTFLSSHFFKNKLKVIQVNSAKLFAVIASMIWNFVLYHIVVFKEKFGDIKDEEIVTY